MSRYDNPASMAAAASYIDNWLEFQRKQKNIPGLEILIKWRGKTLLHECYGKARLGQVFAAASNTKMVTAVALMQLAEQGKLKLSDKVSKHLPWLANHTDKRWRRVSLLHLLNHRSGIARDGSLGEYWNATRSTPNAKTFRQDVLGMDLVYAPGKTYKYSNYGYGVLGQVIEAASGQRYEDYVAEHILLPLGLQHTCFDDHLEGKRVTAGYSREVNRKREALPRIKMRALAPAAGLWSTLADLTTFGEQAIWGSELLTAAGRRQLQKLKKPTGIKDNPYYALGFSHTVTGKHKTTGHGGGMIGFTSRFMAVPKENLTIAIYSNTTSEALLGLCHGALSVMDFFNEHGAPSRRFAAYTGRFENLWSMQEFTAAGDGVYVTNPASINPFSGSDILAHQRAGRFTIADTPDNGSKGQSVEFITRNGKPAYVNWAGLKMKPVKD